MSQYARRFLQAGVRFIGGCCGTTPEHIKLICSEIRSLQPVQRTTAVPPIIEEGKPAVKPLPKVPSAAKSQLGAKLAAGKFVAFVEILPPRGIDASKEIAGARLCREHRVRSFLAHNMTVTPANLSQVADLVRDCHAMGFGMFSFQPAAFVGDNRRWHENYEQVGMDQVWREIEKGAGTALDYTVIQHGDLRCNRAAYGFYVGPRWHPFLSGDASDLAAREAFFRYFGAVNFAGEELPDLIGKVAQPNTPPAIANQTWVYRYDDANRLIGATATNTNTTVSVTTGSTGTSSTSAPAGSVSPSVITQQAAPTQAVVTAYESGRPRRPGSARRSTAGSSDRRIGSRTGRHSPARRGSRTRP